MSFLLASRQKRLLCATACLALAGLGLVRPAAARPFPEVVRSAAFAPATAAVDAPLVSLTAPALIAPGAPISASATALAALSSTSVGYCPGWTCSAPFATEFGSTLGGVLTMVWKALPPDGVYTLVA